MISTDHDKCVCSVDSTPSLPSYWFLSRFYFIYLFLSKRCNWNLRTGLILFFFQFRSQTGFLHLQTADVRMENISGWIPIFNWRGSIRRRALFNECLGRFALGRRADKGLHLGWVLRIVLFPTDGNMRSWGYWSYFTRQATRFR